MLQSDGRSLRVLSLLNFCFLAWMVPLSALALEPVQIDETLTKLSLGLHLEYLEDPKMYRLRPTFVESKLTHCLWIRQRMLSAVSEWPVMRLIPGKTSS